MKREINVFNHAAEIMNAVKNGVLITTKSGDKVNSMTISWGMLGIEWNRPVFITFVRESRFTKEMLDESEIKSAIKAARLLNASDDRIIDMLETGYHLTRKDATYQLDLYKSDNSVSIN